MNRRLTVAVAATTALGLAAGGVVTSAGAAGKAAAPKKNEIVIKGHFVFKPGRFAHDDQRFKPLSASVKSGATVTVRNRAKTKDPHTLSFVEKKFLPVDFEPAAAGPLFELHQLSDDPNAQPVLKIDNGAPAADQNAPLAVDTLGTDQTPGDSELLAPGQKTTSFKVTAAKGSTLYYFCIFHPWMQGKISVK
jgi:plastocyanin